MTVTTTPDTTEATHGDQDAPAPADATPLVSAELLVEDVSIDGMCGVY